MTYEQWKNREQENRHKVEPLKWEHHRGFKSPIDHHANKLLVFCPMLMAVIISIYLMPRWSALLNRKVQKVAICYTTDGSRPTASIPGACSAGSKYDGPFSMKATGTLNVITTSTTTGSTSSCYSTGGSGQPSGICVDRAPVVWSSVKP